jgi:hypothetical protein
MTENTSLIGALLRSEGTTSVQSDQGMKNLRETELVLPLKRPSAMRSRAGLRESGGCFR